MSAARRPTVFGNDKLADSVHVNATVLGIDPVKGELSVRLEFAPQGALGGPGALAKDLKLFVNGASGALERPFAKGKPMNPTDVTVSLFDGQVTDYPFDRYGAELLMYMTTSDAATPGRGAPRG